MEAMFPFSHPGTAIHALTLAFCVVSVRLQECCPSIKLQLVPVPH